MSHVDIASPSQEIIEINGLDSFIGFSRYKPDHPELFLENLELAENLTNNHGAIFYPKGTVISPERVTRLIKLSKNNPYLELSFKIKRSALLIQSFRNDVKKQIVELYKRRMENNEFEVLLSGINKQVGQLIDDTLSDDTITIALYQFGFMREPSDNNKFTRFMEHSLNVALISLAIASTELCGVSIKNDRSILVEICKTAMLHNFGAISKIEKILKISPERWFNLYWHSNLQGLKNIEDYQFGDTITESIRYVCEYYTYGNYDFISQIDRSSVIANIVQTAEIFLQIESGLFAEPQPLKRVVNLLNIRVAEKKINLNTVLALTFGLNLVDLFDYYKELENLASDCCTVIQEFPILSPV